MSASAEPFATRGRCLCGAVTFTVALKTQDVGACHCDMCRTWCGGPSLALDCAAAPVFESDDQLGVYRSSDWAERLFCKTCGSSLFYRLVEGGHYSVQVGAVELDETARLTVQIFTDEKPAYYAFANDTKMMTGAEVFAEFAGGQED
jgi:hypothetical protein